jgi:L-malate glycosyltransferase
METNRKHILILSSWYPTRLNKYVGNFVQRQAELIATKYDVTVLFTKADASVQNIEIVKKKVNNVHEIVIYHPKGNNLFQRYFIQKKAFKTGLKLIKNVDLIHAHVILPKGLQFVTAKKWFNCPLLVTEHGSYFRAEVKKNRRFLDKIILKRLHKQIDKLTSVSEFLKKDLQAEFPKHTIKILPNHIDFDSFIPAQKAVSERTEFLHISTLDEKLKNPKGIIDACSLLLKEGKKDFHLTIISDEPYEKWKKYAIENRLSEHISFNGPLEWKELVPFYQKADAFLLFSNYETFSIVIAEAWACGIPVISTPVGIAHQLPSSLGIQVEINNTESLKNAMLSMMQKDVSFDASYIRSQAEQYAEKHVLSIFDKFYLDLKK